MTERDRLAAAAQAARLRLRPVEIDALLPAWTRYRALVKAFEASVGNDSVPIDG
jgi:hypothetical protein